MILLIVNIQVFLQLNHTKQYNMKVYYLSSINILIVFFNKSGSTLFGAWIENLISFHSIPFEIITSDFEDKLLQINEKKPKIYFFVRNPIERMITSFYWTKTFDIKSQENKFPTEKFIELSNNIESEILSTDDMHFLPQSWELVKINNKIHNRENSMDEFINFRYDKRFFKGCDIRIIQIEGFSKNFNALMQYTFTQRHSLNYKTFEDTTDSFFYKKSFGLIEELCGEDKEKFHKLFAIILFNFVESNMKKLPHHNLLYPEMIKQLTQTKEGVDSLNKINNILQNESKWLGYDNSIILNTMKFQ